MAKLDRFLLAIVAGIVLIVVAAFAVALSRPLPGYLPEDDPAGVAYNYLWALHEQDYERAHSYLSPTISGYPDSPAKFRQVVAGWYYPRQEEVSYTVQLRRMSGDHASVLVRESRYSGSLFSSEYRDNYGMELSLEQNGWKIISSERYSPNCWNIPGGCR